MRLSIELTLGLGGRLPAADQDQGQVHLENRGRPLLLSFLNGATNPLQALRPGLIRQDRQLRAGFALQKPLLAGSRIKQHFVLALAVGKTLDRLHDQPTAH